MILSIETSTKVTSVAIHSEKELLSFQKLHIDKSHANRLTLLIDQSIQNCNITKSDLTGIAISEGPGSYTGLRIGASTAKGLAYGLDIPLIAVNTLAAMARQVAKQHLPSNALLLPMIDARRMEVFTATYDLLGKEITATHPLILEAGSLSEIQNGFFFGDGASKCQEILPHLTFIDYVTPLAIEVGEIALEKLSHNQIVDTAYFEPFYLKEFRIGVPSKSKKSNIQKIGQ